MLRRSLALASLILPLMSGGPARGEVPAPSVAINASSLRPEWTVQKTPAGRTSVVGYLYNRNVLDASNVWLRVERLGPDGEVAGTYRARLVGDVFSNDRLAFDVPISEAAASYRVVVESVDWHDDCR